MTIARTGDRSKGKKIVILGGGFAGLRIAYLLDKLEYRISLIEKTRNLGGMVQTFSHEYGGEQFLFDFGPHLFFEDYVSEYYDLLGQNMIPITDRFLMCTPKTILSYPLRPIEILTRTNPITSIAYLLDLFIEKFRQHGTDRENSNLDDFLAKRFGRKLFLEFYSPYIEKCCGLAPDQISVLWAKERENVSGKSLLENVTKKIKSLLSRRTRQELVKANDPSASNITAWYPRLGAGQLCDAMAKELKSQSVYLHSTIRQINVKGNTIQNVVVEVEGREKTINGDYYVSTLPLPHFFEYLNPVSSPLMAAARELKYRNVRLICLIIRKERILNCLEMFSMDKRHLFKRVYEPKALSNIMSPEGKSSLCLEVCCDTGDNILTMAANTLISKCIKDLIRMKLLRSSEEVTDSFIVEMPHAYPIYAKGFSKYRQQLLQEIARFDNLLTCGRQGLFRYHAMTNEVMEMAGSIAHFLDGHRDKGLADNKTSPWGQLFY